eukprot:TRINITY_DN2539_c0_g1_i2.p1 TRINITY_DN2539_c0_g1~~TRINITY_DN2539_c0_g1_i2.p1  ORF type:complete len:2405 (-),score=378.30 TRINITY_DN2539_c0_g1_i2:956-7465(-)
MTDEELKNEDKKNISEVILHLDALLRHVAAQHKAAEVSEKLNMTVALKCFRSPYLEKRLSGLNDIKEFISMSCNRHPYPQLMLGRNLAKWIKDEKIMESLYGQNMHVELIKRCQDIPRFLVQVDQQLEKEYLDLIWEASLGKHESIQNIIYTTVAELAPYLQLAEIDYLFERIQAISYENYNANLLALVRNFSLPAIRANAKSKNRKWYGLKIFFDLMQDETNISFDLTQQALTNMIEFLHWPECYLKRADYIKLCIDNLKNNKSVPQSLKLLFKIMTTFPRVKRKKGESILDQIEQLESQYNILTLFFNDLVIYKQKAKQIICSGTLDTSKGLNNINLCGKYSHLSQISERLDFLYMILVHSTLSLNKEQLDIFWSTIILQSLTPEERDQGFCWLENSRNSQEEPFSDELTSYLFNQKLVELDLSSFSPQGYKFFEYFFIYLNTKANHIVMLNKQFEVASFNLIGLDTLWKIALEAIDSTVGSHTLQLLRNLLKQASPKLRQQSNKQREDYIRICMDFLVKAASQLPAADQSQIELLQLRIDRCLTLLKGILDDFESGTGSGNRRHGASVRGTPILVNVTIVQGSRFSLNMHSNETIGALRQKVAEQMNQASQAHLLRLIMTGKELKPDGSTLSDFKFAPEQAIHVTRRQTHKYETEDTSFQIKSPGDADNDVVLPSAILSSPRYFHQLFQLLNLHEGISQKIWDLLMLLPTNNQLLEELRTLKTDVNWNELLDPVATFKLLYSLQIVDFLMQTTDETKVKENEEWCKLFISKGGLHHLLNILMSHNLLDESRGRKRVSCCGLLLKIINYFLLDIREFPILHENVLRDYLDPKQIPTKLLELTFVAATAPLPASGSLTESIGQVALAFGATKSEESLVTKHAIDLLVACCLADKNLLLQTLCHSSFPQWLSATVLSNPDRDSREHVTEGLYALCINITDPSLGHSLPHTFFLEQLLKFLPEIDAPQNTCEQYFLLLNKLITDACEGKAGGLPADFTTLFKNLVDRLFKHPIIEERNSEDEDKLLKGLMIVITTLINKNPTFKAEVGKCGIIQEVFYKCLFEIPTMHNHGPLAPPKCKTKASRSVAYALLNELARECEPNFRQLTDLLLQQHVGGERRVQWSYHPLGYEKAPCGFVGMKNLGATCYMNSLMQQFYMIPQFRYHLLAIDTSSEADRSNSLFYQLQSIFGYLQESEKKYYDTRPFCNSYKDNGQPMNPSVQMDADEFFNILFDKLENILKITKQEGMLKQFFGGTITNQIISKECSHVSEREENFYTLSLEIKNKKNIEESLDLYVEGDMLEGDNKYFCGQCSRKVDALKRCCIKTLPNVLIIHMKRFEFDLEIMKRIKVNDACEFPHVLNMEPYTKEGLAVREDPSRANGQVEHHPSSYYEYSLSGVLVHTGTADSGHYYSFIKDRPSGSWYHFNDQVVEPFDPRDLQRNCFGGSDVVQQWDNVQQKYVNRMHPRVFSAYMLFYERTQPENLPETIQLSPAMTTSSLVPADIYKSVWDENMMFLRDKYVFDSDYFLFLWNIITSVEHVGSSPPPAVLGFAELPEEGEPFHAPMRAIVLATKFIVETLSHAKEKHYLKYYVDHLKTLYQQHIPACIWFLKRLTEDLTWVRQMLMVCIHPETREAFAHLITHVIKCLVPYEHETYSAEIEAGEENMEISPGPSADNEKKEEIMRSPSTSKSLIIRFMDGLLVLLKDASAYWRHFGQFFLVLRDFASLGPKERLYFLRKNTISRLLDFYFGEDSPTFSKSNVVLVANPMGPQVPSQFLVPGGMGAGNRKKTKIGDKFNIPNLSHMLEFVAVLVRGCATDSSILDRHSPTVLPGEVLSLSKPDREVVYNLTFYQRAIRENVNVEATSQILQHLCWENEDLSRRVLEMVTKGIHQADFESFRPYFETLRALLSINDSRQANRVHTALVNFQRVIEQNIKFRNETAYCLKFLAELVRENDEVRGWMYKHRNNYLEDWIFHASDLVRDCAEDLVRSLVPEVPYQMAFRVPPTYPGEASQQGQSPAQNQNSPSPMVISGPMAPVSLSSNSTLGIPRAVPISPDAMVEAPNPPPEEALEKIRELLKIFLSMLPKAKNYYSRGEHEPIYGDEGHTPAYWRLTAYLRLMKWCLFDAKEKQLFAAHFDPFFQLFNHIDQYQLECDENKRVLSSFSIQKKKLK